MICKSRASASPPTSRPITSENFTKIPHLHTTLPDDMELKNPVRVSENTSDFKKAFREVKYQVPSTSQSSTPTGSLWQYFGDMRDGKVVRDVQKEGGASVGLKGKEEGSEKLAEKREQVWALKDGKWVKENVTL